ncbi:hypothetical protein Acr_05g0000460 [Actinidia rufa]|uniref:Uncharacterized protein n=1 Tax=Actinidia rufa TaxID=165716 RepID=A0A7J0ELA2_9ERIC|nr:hypothetical protein Acr_05g0000460 [Actinidia rufa]
MRRSSVHIRWNVGLTRAVVSAELGDLRAWRPSAPELGAVANKGTVRAKAFVIFKGATGQRARNNNRVRN